MEKSENIKISVGIPVFKAESTVSNALDSLASQTCREFEVIISDNQSTDKTFEICNSYRDVFRDFKLVRQECNIGAMANFKYVLESAKSDFFFWLAGDDVLIPTYIEKCRTFLEEHPDYVCCGGKVLFRNQAREWTSDGTYSLEKTVTENMSEYLSNPGDNSRFYHMYRRDVLAASFEQDMRYFGSDWYLMLKTLEYGKHKELDRILLVRGVHGESNDRRIFLNTQSRKIEAIIPLYTFAGKAFSLTRKYGSFLIFLRILKLVLITTKWYISSFLKQKKMQIPG